MLNQPAVVAWNGTRKFWVLQYIQTRTHPLTTYWKLFNRAINKWLYYLPAVHLSVLCPGREQAEDGVHAGVACQRQRLQQEAVHRHRDSARTTALDTVSRGRMTAVWSTYTLTAWRFLCQFHMTVCFSRLTALASACTAAVIKKSHILNTRI